MWAVERYVVSNRTAKSVIEACRDEHAALRLQEPAGWETERMVRRYAHLAADHLAAYVGNAQIHGTFLAHQPKLPKLLNEKLLEVQ